MNHFVPLTAIFAALILSPASLAAAEADSGPPAPPKVDPARAYGPEDLALLEGVIAKAGIPTNLIVIARQIGDHVDFTGCPASAKAAFVDGVASHLDEQKAQLRAEVASGFDPLFSHAELVALNRYYQLTPIFLMPDTKLPDPKPLSDSEKAEADALVKDPGVVRYNHSLATAIAPLQGEMARVATTALHESCPTKWPGTSPR